MWWAVIYFSTYCFNCFCLMKVVSSVLLFNLLRELFFVSLRWWAVFYFSTYCFNGFYLMKVVSSVLLFNLLFLLFLWRGCAVFYFSTYCANCFLFNKVVCSVLLFNVLFQLFLFNEGGEQCFTFQLIVRIVFCLIRRWAVLYFSTYCFNCFCLMKVVCSVLLFNLLFQLFFV